MSKSKTLQQYQIRDAKRAYCLLVTKKPKFGETYNIGGNTHFVKTNVKLLNKAIM